MDSVQMTFPVQTEMQFVLLMNYWKEQNLSRTLTDFASAVNRSQEPLAFLVPLFLMADSLSITPLT